MAVSSWSGSPVSSIAYISRASFFAVWDKATCPWLVSWRDRQQNTDVLGSVVNGKAQVSGASLLHAGVAVVELPRLVGKER